MPTVTQNKYKNNETQVYDYLRNELGFNNAVASGILANIWYESSFNRNAEAMDTNGALSYGLVMWNGSNRTSLIDYCAKNNLDYTSVEGQMEYLKYDLNTPYQKSIGTLAKLQSLPDNASGAYDAGYYFCTMYERPSDKHEKGIERGTKANEYYLNYIDYDPSNPNSSGVSATPNLGQQIAATAISKIGCPYSQDADKRLGPDIFDCSGLAIYCYKQAGIDLKGGNSIGIYNTYKDSATVVSADDIRAGDLIFYTNTVDTDRVPPITHVAIATGDGYMIEAAGTDKGVIKSKIWGTPYTILRILSDSETSKGSYDYESLSTQFGNYVSNIPSYGNLNSVDPYASKLRNNLEKVTAEGYDYGYLIDVTYGGSFKFYIPEFSESAGSKWSTINIIGRSVEILSYEYTSSRTVNVSLDLFAGAGLYELSPEEDQTTDIVGKLHSDMNFLKSLEYPDYTSAIVRPPAAVHLLLGAAFNMLGVVSDVDIEHLKPVDETNRAMHVKASFKVTQIAVDPPDWRDIRYATSSITSTSNVGSITNIDATDDVIIDNVEKEEEDLNG